MERQRVAVIITQSDGPAANQIVRMLGFEAYAPRDPSVQTVTGRVPDLIVFDWEPSRIKENTKLLEQIKASAISRSVPVLVLHSAVRDVPDSVLTTELVVALEIPIGFDVIKRALRRLDPSLVPEDKPRPSAEAVEVSRPIRGKPRQSTGKRLRSAHPKTQIIIGRNKVFIGHGRSMVWRDLRDFLTERLKLDYVEFNRESAAGIPTANRLDDMLKKAAFAFVILTAEDQHSDGSMHARENAIHEVGLFQGRLGLRRAIVLLEEGCDEFTNIRGLGQIRFPRGNLLQKSEEIRKVLEREGILTSGH